VSKGNEIIVSSAPEGIFLEGVIADTSKPGNLMMVKAATSFLGGRPTFVLMTVAADGTPSLIAVLLEDSFQGKLITDAYVSGTRCRLYCPLAGEEMNVLVGEGAGTSNTFAIGDYFMYDQTDNILVPTAGSPASRPFQCLETVTQVASPNLTYCFYTGH
jgi:hypothetical protein